MKKIFVLILVISLSGISLYAQENFDYSKFGGISLGIAGDITGDITSGLFDFSFNFYQNNESGFFVRNHIEINIGGFGGSDFEVNTFGFRERVSIGNIMPITDDFGIKAYAIIDFGFSFFDGVGKSDIFTAPYMLEAGVGGGMELLFAVPKNSKIAGSTFFEVGGRYRFFVGDNDINIASIGIRDATAFIRLGFRIYF